jgi:hypothetical protein
MLLLEREDNGPTRAIADSIKRVVSIKTMNGPSKGSKE